MRYAPLVVLAAVACSKPAPAPAAATADPERAAAWREDLDALVVALQRHPRPFFHAHEAAWRAEVAALRDAIPALDDAHVVTRLVHLAAALGDSHTRLFLPRDKLYPVRFLGFEDGIFVAGGLPHAIGHRVTAVDGKPIADVVAALTTLVPAENDAFVAGEIPQLLENPVALAGLDLAHRDDARVEVTLDDAPPLELTAGRSVPLAPPRVQPLHLSGPTQDAYWNKYVDSDRLLYFQYNACEDDPRVGPFAAFAASTLAFADQHPVDRFVIDLRSNQGGTSQIAQPLIDGLAARPALAGRVFVLIGRATFSSAVINASQLSARLHATLVGTPTGGNPNGYGEVKPFQLPRSHLAGQVSSKLFADPSFHGTTIPPDVLVHVRADDWFSGRDPAIDAVLAAPVPTRE